MSIKRGYDMIAGAGGSCSGHTSKSTVLTNAEYEKRKADYEANPEGYIDPDTGLSFLETIYLTNDDIESGGNISIEVDEELSLESENPVMNKVVAAKMNELEKRDTELVMKQMVVGSTAEDIGSIYDNFSNDMEIDTWYRGAVGHDVGYSPLGGGIWYLEGYKCREDHEWQKVTRCDTMPKRYERYKNPNGWQPWEKVASNNLVLESTKSVYVDATNGDDTTGDGSDARPWKTIQKAINECPTVFNDATSYNIGIRDGEYTENVVIRNKPNVNLHFSDNDNGVILNGGIEVTVNSRVHFNKKLTINISSSRAIGVTNKAFVYLGGTSHINIIGKNTTDSIYGIYVSEYADMIIYSNNLNKISNVNCGVLCGSNSTVYINGLEIDSTCNIGTYAYGGTIYHTDANNKNVNNAVVSPYKEANGGRNNRYSQGWQTIGSVTGATVVTIDKNLYTEFLIEVAYNGMKINGLISSLQLRDEVRTHGVASIITSSSSNYLSANVNTTSNVIELHEVYNNGTNITASATMTVFGRRA